MQLSCAQQVLVAGLAACTKQDNAHGLELTSGMQSGCAKVWMYYRTREGEARMDRHRFANRVSLAAPAGCGVAVLTKRRGGHCACVQESMRHMLHLSRLLLLNAPNFGRVGVCQQQYRCWRMLFWRWLPPVLASRNHLCVCVCVCVHVTLIRVRTVWGVTLCAPLC